MRAVRRKPGRIPRPAEQRYPTISFSLPPELLQRLEAVRGYTPRSEIIAQAIQEWLERQEHKHA